MNTNFKEALKNATIAKIKTRNNIASLEREIAKLKVKRNELLVEQEKCEEQERLLEDNITDLEAKFEDVWVNGTQDEGERISEEIEGLREEVESVIDSFGDIEDKIDVVDADIINYNLEVLHLFSELDGLMKDIKIYKSAISRQEREEV